jgi:hypothetical protein
VSERWRTLVADSASWLADMRAAEERAAPVLAGGERPDAAIGAALRAELLERLANDPANMLQGTTAEAPLDGWLRAEDPRLARKPGPPMDNAFEAGLVARFRGVQVGDTIFFPRGKYRVDEDLVLPPGIAVVMERGARFEMGAGASIVVLGPLHVRGTSINPVFVRAVDGNTPFGTLAVVGNGSTPCRLSGLRMSGGAGAMLNGVRHPGMCTVTDAVVHVEESTFGPAGDAPALVLRHAVAELAEAVFWEGYAPQLVLDDVQGRLRNTVLVHRDGSRSTSALELAASSILLDGCTFEVPRGTAVQVDDGAALLATHTRFTTQEPSLRLGPGARIDLHQVTHRANVPLAATDGAGRPEVHVYATELTENALHGLQHRMHEALDTVLFRKHGWEPPVRRPRR